MSGDATGMATPEGWPGHLWLEGRTIIHLKQEQERPTHMPRGPLRIRDKVFLTLLWLQLALAQFFF
jgi:hypothetical protein